MLKAILKTVGITIAYFVMFVLFGIGGVIAVTIMAFCKGPFWKKLLLALLAIVTGFVIGVGASLALMAII